MKAAQYTSVFIKPKYNNILQFNHKAVGVFLSFYIPAYIYMEWHHDLHCFLIMHGLNNGK